MKPIPIAAFALAALVACNQADTANSSAANVADNSAADEGNEANLTDDVETNATDGGGKSPVGKPQAEAGEVDADVLADKPPAVAQDGEKPSD
jgi:hypothetical protein